MVPAGMPKPFHTGHLAKALGVKRWVAQRIAYCYRHMGTVVQVGKQGNAHLYEFTKGPRKSKAGKKKVVKKKAKKNRSTKRAG